MAVVMDHFLVARVLVLLVFQVILILQRVLYMVLHVAVAFVDAVAVFLITAATAVDCMVAAVDFCLLLLPKLFLIDQETCNVAAEQLAFVLFAGATLPSAQVDGKSIESRGCVYRGEASIMSALFVTS